MKMSCRAVSVLAFILSLGVSVASAQAPASPLDARAEALKGQVELTNLPHPNGIEWGRAEGVIDAAPNDVLAILNDYSAYAGVFPYFEKSKVLSQRGSDALVYLEAKVLYGASTLWSQVKITARSPTPATRVIEVKMMKGKGNIGNLLARFEVTPIDGGQKTFVAFQFLVDPDLPMPDSVVSSEMKKGAGSAFRALRKKVAQRVYASRSNHAM
jgi:ribosome-associated toxin RatA of RatAB toxin-antitoxin module